jgi:CRISPR-associated protein Cmr1
MGTNPIERRRRATGRLGLVEETVKQLHSTYTLVRPMFLGGALPKAAEIGFRPPSFKGALRFWWRALAWAQVAQETNDVVAALRDLHRREAEVFGSAAGERGRQSRVLLAADWQPGRPISDNAVRSQGRSGQDNGIGYLMGQGLGGRTAADSGTIRVRATFLPGTSEEGRQGVERALLVLGLLGGLGSRCRRGFGSLAIEELEGDRRLDLAIPRTVDQLATVLKLLIGDRPPAQPPYSAFSAQSRIDLSLLGPSAARVHCEVGGKMREFREALADDTRRAREAADGKEPDQPPDRTIFGLPLQFYFKRDRATVFVEPARNRAKLDRRASPLLIHIHCLTGESAGGRFVALQTFLPAQFLPEQVGVQVRRKGGRSFPFPRFSPPEALVAQYLDGFPGPRTLLP